MRHEDTAVTLFCFATIFICVAFFSVQYWDDIVEPVISVSGAFINTLSLPVIGMLLIVAFGLMVKNIHSR